MTDSFNEEQVVDETLEVTDGSQDESTEEVDIDELRKKAEIAENYKIRAEKAEREKKALEAKLNQSAGKPLEVEDFINISASLEGLDQREKEYLATQHKLTGKKLTEIRNDEDFVLWQSAYRQKVEKQNGLTPSGTQGELEKPKSVTEKLKTSDMKEKEELLAQMGLYKNPASRFRQ